MKKVIVLLMQAMFLMAFTISKDGLLIPQSVSEPESKVSEPSWLEGTEEEEPSGMWEGDQNDFTNQIQSMLDRAEENREALRAYIEGEGEETRYGYAFYVSPKGSDKNPGTKEKPFKTLTKARDAVRAYKKSHGIPAGGIVVWLRGGRYYQPTSFILGSEDSGKEGRPIVYRSYPGERATVTGGKELPNSWFKPIEPSDSNWNRLEREAQNHVYVFDLKSYGVKDTGALQWDKSGASAPMEIFEDDQALTLSRWPNKGETTNYLLATKKDVRLYGNTTPYVAGNYKFREEAYPLYIRDGKLKGVQYSLRRKPGSNPRKPIVWKILGGSKTLKWEGYSGGYNLPREFYLLGKEVKGIPSLLAPEDKQYGFAMIAKGINGKTFQYAGDAPDHWKMVDDIWVNGMFYRGWSTRHVKIGSIDKTRKRITFTKVPPYGIRSGEHRQPYYVYNVLEELDEPGEYYIDRERGKLYLWPLKEMDQSKFYASMNKKSVIGLENASWIEFNGLTIEISRGYLIRIKDGSHNLITRSILRYSGNGLVKISGYENGVSYCEMTGAGEEGATLMGGNRARLKAAKNFVVHSHIHHNGRWIWTYRGAARIEGVGNIFEHNDVHDELHEAIQYIGNNHRIQYNNIYKCLKYAEDSGVIYSGRDWGYRGNKINYNFIHDIVNHYGGNFICAIYFDDQVSGEEAKGNVFYRIDGIGVFVNGGRDHKVENNIFDNVFTVFFGNNSGLKAVNNKPGSSRNLLERLKRDGVDYQGSVWRNAYPELAKMPNNWNRIKSEGWLYPKGNSFKNNIGIDIEQWVRGYSAGVYDKYKYFDSKPLTKMTEKFEPIPYSRIGIQLP